MSQYIPADQVFEDLFNKKIVTKFKWKNTNPTKNYYMVSFDYSANGLLGVHTFQIIVENNNHYITKRAFEVFAHKIKTRTF